MLKFTRKQACAVALSALFSLAVFSAPLIYASEMPLASSPVTEPTEPAEPIVPSDPAPVVSEAPVVSTPETSQPSGDTSLPPVASGEPGETVSGGIEPLPEDPSSGMEGQTSESPSSAETVSSEEPAESQQQTIIPSQPEYNPPVIQNPDTDQDLIDQLASHAATANSDPEALTSQDWSELLSQAGGDSSSSDSSSAGGAILPTDDDSGNSGDMTTSTRSSWLLPVGIVCILLAFAGFAVFVYLQFIAPRMKAASSHSSPAPLTGGRTDPSVESMTDSDGSGILKVHRPSESHAPVRPEKPTAEEQALASQETMEISTARLQESAPQRPEMEDIFSSDEAEKIVREGGARQAQPPQAENTEPATPAAPNGPAQAPDTPAAPAPASNAAPRPKAQATPVSPESDKPFDWDKFFEE